MEYLLQAIFGFNCLISLCLSELTFIFAMHLSNKGLSAFQREDYVRKSGECSIQHLSQITLLLKNCQLQCQPFCIGKLMSTRNGVIIRTLSHHSLSQLFFCVGSQISWLLKMLILALYKYYTEREEKKSWHWAFQVHAWQLEITLGNLCDFAMQATLTLNI